MFGTVAGVAWQDIVDGGRRWLGHELLHHMGGHGGGRGGRVAPDIIWPPQQGQMSIAWPVRRRRRSCQGRGGGLSGGGGTASRSRHSANFSVRWRLARKPI